MKVDRTCGGKKEAKKKNTDGEKEDRVRVKELH